MLASSDTPRCSTIAIVSSNDRNVVIETVETLQGQMINDVSTGQKLQVEKIEYKFKPTKWTGKPPNLLAHSHLALSFPYLRLHS